MIVELDLSCTIDGFVVLQEVDQGCCGENRHERTAIYRWTPDQAEAFAHNILRCAIRARPTWEAIRSKKSAEDVAAAEERFAKAARELDDAIVALRRLKPAPTPQSGP